MKKTGIKKPKPTASSLPANSCASVPLVTIPTMIPAAKAPRITSSPNCEASTARATIKRTARRTASWPLVPIVVSTNRTTRVGRARIANTLTATTTAAKTNRSSGPPRLVGIERQDHRDDHHRAELGRGPGADDVVAEALVQDPGVAQDRHQRAERRRRQRQGDEHGGVDHAGDVQGDGRHGADPDRHHPAADAELGRGALDALEVDLHPGQEEQEGEPEGRERLDEVVGAGEVEHLRADDDSQGDLGDHDRHLRLAAEVGEHRREDGDRRDNEDVGVGDLHRSRETRARAGRV